MFRLRVAEKFDAAHKLVGYKGKCSQLHGHTWNVEVFIVGKELDEIGMLADFTFLKKKLREVTKRLDHCYLNDNLEIGNPTSENISKFIFEKFGNLSEGLILESVRVWESPESWCEYFENKQFHSKVTSTADR